MLCYATLCYAMLYYAMLCYAMLCCAMLWKAGAYDGAGVYTFADGASYDGEWRADQRFGCGIDTPAACSNPVYCVAHAPRALPRACSVLVRTFLTRMPLQVRRRRGVRRAGGPHSMRPCAMLCCAMLCYAMLCYAVPRRQARRPRRSQVRNRRGERADTEPSR
jgi:hypothetical protein